MQAPRFAFDVERPRKLGVCEHYCRRLCMLSINQRNQNIFEYQGWRNATICRQIFRQFTGSRVKIKQFFGDHQVISTCSHVQYAQSVSNMSMGGGFRVRVRRPCLLTGVLCIPLTMSDAASGTSAVALLSSTGYL